MAERDWGAEAGPLADRLSIIHQHPSPSGKIGLCTCPKCPDMRAAAEGLRLLAEVTAERDRLRDAIGDPRQLIVDGRWCSDLADTLKRDDYHEVTWEYLVSIGADLLRIAAAAGVSAETGEGPTDG